MSITATVRIVDESCCACGAHFGVEYHFQRRCRDKGTPFYCPNGHRMTYTEPQVSRLERQVQRERQRADQAEAQAQAERNFRHGAERQLSAARGIVTRTKNRIKAGVCPCCNRTFANLARHMKGQHPDYGED